MSDTNSKLRLLSALCLIALAAVGCGPAGHQRRADRAAERIIQQKQREALGEAQEFTIERPADTLRRRLLLDQHLPYSGKESLGTDQLDPPKHWPQKARPASGEAPENSPSASANAQPLHLTLIDALQVAARNNRDYQSDKENVFQAALDLDLERDEFRNSYAGLMEGLLSENRGGESTVTGLTGTASAELTRKLKTGATLTSHIALDLVKLLSQDKASSMGILADATISIPLLRGARKHIVTEPLTQAERNVVYAIQTLERFKQTVAVRVATAYLAVLQQLDQVQNAEDNYRSLIASARRARRLADAGRLSEIQVDQAQQDELRARERWISAQKSYERQLDTFKITLGIPTDARVELDRSELQRLAESAGTVLGTASEPQAKESTDGEPEAIEPVPPSHADAGPLELEPSKAIQLAFEHRLDLEISRGRVYDAQRDVIVAADGLRADVTLTGTAKIGEGRSLSSAGSPDAKLRTDKGTYTTGLALELPWERTAERNAYRKSFIALERAVRDVQELEDQMKLAIRDALRNLVQARESHKIQAQALRLAQRRVQSTELFLQAGRAQIRDVLEAQEALVSAQNALTAALVDYRVAELELQRDMGVLAVNEKGLWREYSGNENE